MSENKKNVLVFSDPGLDDALAITWMLTQKNINVLGLVPVAGNHSVEQVTKNMVKLLANMEIYNVPIYCTSDYIQEYHQLPEIHGEDAIGDFLTDCYGTGKIKISKFENIYENTSNEKFEIISLGPCTVLAEFLRKSNLKPAKMTVMGGYSTVEGNFNSNQNEFNFGMDRVAAEYVGSYRDCPVAIMPLDVTRQYALPETINVENGRENEHMKLFKTLCEAYLGLANKRGRKQAFPHDLTAAISLTNSEIFEWDAGVVSINGSKVSLKDGSKDRVATKILATQEKIESIIMGGFNAL